MRPLGHPPPPPVLRPCWRPLQLLDQPCFLRLEGSLCGGPLPSCCCCCCCRQLLLHIISASICLVFLAVAFLSPCCSASHPPPGSVGPTQQQQREAGFWLRSQNDPPLPLSLPFHYPVAFFLDLWLWLMHRLLFLPLRQQLACSVCSLSRPPMSV